MWENDERKWNVGAVKSMYSRICYRFRLPYKGGNQIIYDTINWNKYLYIIAVIKRIKIVEFASYSIAYKFI